MAEPACGAFGAWRTRFNPIGELEAIGIGSGARANTQLCPTCSFAADVWWGVEFDAADELGGLRLRLRERQSGTSQPQMLVAALPRLNQAVRFSLRLACHSNSRGRDLARL